MSRFEFVMVLVSIIVGLGVTELLTNVTRQIRARATTKFYWVHSGLVAALFIGLLQQWWESWILQATTDWSFAVLLLMLAAPISLYTISHLIFPADFEGVDFEEYYFANSRLLWGIAAFGVVAATSFHPLAFGRTLFAADNLASLVLAATCVVMAVTKNRRVHAAAVFLVLGAVVLDIAFFSFVI